MDKEMNSELALDDLAEGLQKSREQNGICPSRKQGTEVDGGKSHYCPLTALKCEFKGRHHCYDDGDFHLLNFQECLYKKQRTED